MVAFLVFLVVVNFASESWSVGLWIIGKGKSSMANTSAVHTRCIALASTKPSLPYVNTSSCAYHRMLAQEAIQVLSLNNYKKTESPKKCIWRIPKGLRRPSVPVSRAIRVILKAKPQSMPMPEPRCQKLQYAPYRHHQSQLQVMQS